MALSIGERLKSAREAKGVNLEEVANATKVQRKTLQAIEEDRVEETLDPAYVKIFLKKYALFLGLDASSLVEEYVSVRGPLPQASLTLETQVTKKTQVSPFKRLLVPVSVGVMALIGLSFLGTLSLDLYRTLTQNQKHTKAPRPASAAKKLPEAAKSIVSPSQMLKLTIRVKTDVWIQVKSDGTVIFQNVLSKGSQENWSARKELELWTGNAGATELFLNGKPLDGLGYGVKKGIKITHKGLELPG